LTEEDRASCAGTDRGLRIAWDAGNGLSVTGFIRREQDRGIAAPSCILVFRSNCRGRLDMRRGLWTYPLDTWSREDRFYANSSVYHEKVANKVQYVNGKRVCDYPRWKVRTYTSWRRGKRKTRERTCPYSPSLYD
jgi:hypothetical protein